MAFDAGFLSFVVREIGRELADSRLERIFQCTRDTFVLEFRAAKKPRSLFISAGPSGGFCYLTERKIAHPDTPPMFCMLLRKHLSGGRFLRAEQIGFERVVRFDIEFIDAFGNPLLRTLYLEAMGKFSNLVLCDEKGVILGALRTLDLAQSPDRPLLCGMQYTPPPLRAHALSLMDDNLNAHIVAAFHSASAEQLACDVLLQSVLGIAPLIAKELVFRSCQNTQATVSEIEVSALLSEVQKLREALLQERACFNTVVRKDGQTASVVAFSYVVLEQYTGVSCVTYSSASRLLDAVAGSREAAQQLNQRTERAWTILRNAQKRLRKKLDAQLSDLASAESCDEKRLAGDLITQEIWRLKRGDTRLIATDYLRSTEVEVALDARLTPAQNAQRYYKQYQKQRRALSFIQQQIEITREELAYAQSIAEALSRVETLVDADQICREVSEWNYSKRFTKVSTPSSKKAKKAPAIQVQSLESPSGFCVFVGKNNLQNEHVTFHLADKLDFWFHAKGHPGPHVVLHVEGADAPTQQDFEFCAKLAVPANLRGVGCEVDYTRVKAVKHHVSRLPGRVFYTGGKTIFVRNER